MPAGTANHVPERITGTLLHKHLTVVATTYKQRPREDHREFNQQAVQRVIINTIISFAQFPSVATKEFVFGSFISQNYIY
jgi:hypothetical protein